MTKIEQLYLDYKAQLDRVAVAAKNLKDDQVYLKEVRAAKRIKDEIWYRENDRLS